MSLWEMSLNGGVMIVVVVLLRALFINRLPKKTFLILWGIIMLRLVIPFQFSSVCSIYTLIPEQKQQTKSMQNNLEENMFHNMGAWENKAVSGVSDEKIEYQELLKEYERFGITDENGILYYKGEVVRLFLDGYENGETLISRYTKLNEDGTVDVHTVRNDEKNEDGRTDDYDTV